MLDNLETHNWDEVMGENVVPIQSRMLWQPVKLLRSTRLHSEGKSGKARMMYVIHDIKFVEWRLQLLLKDCDENDIPLLKQAMAGTIQNIKNKNSTTTIKENKKKANE